MMRHAGLHHEALQAETDGTTTPGKSPSIFWTATLCDTLRQTRPKTTSNAGARPSASTDIGAASATQGNYVLSRTVIEALRERRLRAC